MCQKWLFCHSLFIKEEIVSRVDNEITTFAIIVPHHDRHVYYDRLTVGLYHSTQGVERSIYLAYPELCTFQLSRC